MESQIITTLAETGIRFIPVNARGMMLDLENKVAKGYDKSKVYLYELDIAKDFDYAAAVFKGTDYVGVDIDIKGEDKEAVRAEVDNIFHQFEGYHERSKGGYGIHAIIKNRELAEKLRDAKAPLKISSKDTGLNFDIEIFGGHAPLSLTGNIIADPVIDINDIVPKKIRENPGFISALEYKNPSTKRKTVTVDSALIEIDIINRVISKAKENPDAEKNIINGYPARSDCSKVDHALASIFLEAANNTPSLAIPALETWMIDNRSRSHCKKSASEIKNKAKRAIESVWKGDLKTMTRDAFKKPGLKDAMRKKSTTAKAIAAKLAKSRPLIEGMIFEGTLNTIVGKSGSGKSKMVTIMCMEIAKKYPEKIIYYFGSDLSVDDVQRINEIADLSGLSNFYLDQDTTGKEFLEMMETTDSKDDAKDIVFVVDTVKKITPVNNKDKVSENFKVLKTVTSRGGTGILIAHTNKDGKDMSGVAEFEQDVDNVVSVEAEYLGEDKMRSTMSTFKRCRSRIVPITYEMSRDGFDYIISDEVVDPIGQALKGKEAERRGNIEEKIISIVAEYADREEELTTTKLRKVIMEDDYYTGTKKTAFVSNEISRASNEQLINTTQKGRKKIFTPLSLPDFSEKGNENEEV